MDPVPLASPACRAAHSGKLETPGAGWTIDVELTGAEEVPADQEQRAVSRDRLVESSDLDQIELPVDRALTQTHLSAPKWGDRTLATGDREPAGCPEGLEAQLVGSAAIDG